MRLWRFLVRGNSKSRPPHCLHGVSRREDCQNAEDRQSDLELPYYYKCCQCGVWDMNQYKLSKFCSVAEQELIEGYHDTGVSSS